MKSEILLSTLFSNWGRRYNVLEKARFLQNRRKIVWNLDEISKSNQVRLCSYYSIRVPSKFHRKTTDRMAAQSLSRVIDRVRDT